MNEVLRYERRAKEEPRRGAHLGERIFGLGEIIEGAHTALVEHLSTRIAALEQEIADRAGLTAVLVREEIRRISSFDPGTLYVSLDVAR